MAKPHINEAEKQAVIEVLDSGILAQGPRVKKFEERFADYCGTKHAVATNSGTAALHTALYALGVGDGDEVITTPFTFVATANVILMQRARPIFVDIKEDTFNIDPDKIREKITPKTKAIIVVDLFGQLADYEKIEKIADEYNLKIIEDGCQAVAATINGKKTGTFGDCAAFSFYATKNLITGEGGMITTDDARAAERARMFRHHGQNEKTRYEYRDFGYNYRMTDIQAAIGLCQLDKIDNLTAIRRKNASLLTEGLKNISGLITPFVKDADSHVFHQYTIKLTDEFPLTREELAAKLKDAGVMTAVFYPKPLHLQPMFAKFGYRLGDFPVTEKVCKQVLSLPVPTFVTETDVKKIVALFKEIPKC